ncbi:MAG: hypothetical protein M9945_12270 [Aquamicrobium sp.]|uniref:hypothetical protein n=1 Tax=Aquamicrobium sp. TaxID=1872579 RepID=UPI00349E649D|nr:hypothetical protein [Aquamicrobium sp.]
MQTLDLLNDFIPRGQLAHALNLSTRTLMRYEQQPDGLPSLMIGGRKFYRAQSVRDWLAKRETQPNPRRR